MHTRIERYERELATTREEKTMLFEELTAAQAGAEGHRSQASALRVAISEMEGKLAERDEQLAALGGRLSVARDDLSVQLAMVQEEVRGAQLKLEARDLALEVQMEQTADREQQAKGFVSEVGAKLKRAHQAMVAKDALLSSVGAKLHSTVDALKKHEESAGELRRAADKERHEREALATQMSALEERHSLVTADLSAASDALDSYRDTLIHAEARMRQDRETMTALQQELRDLSTKRAVGGAGTAPGGLGLPAPTGGSGAHLPLPPLSSAASGAEIGASRVHYLYFLASFLLLKTALSQQGQMSNVAAQDVFDEIVRNEVPLEEWPTYIFTRTFAQRGAAGGGGVDGEISALKAVAKHADEARHGGAPQQETLFAA